MKNKKQTKNMFKCLGCERFYPNNIKIIVPSELRTITLPLSIQLGNRLGLGCCSQHCVKTFRSLLKFLSFAQWLSKPISKSKRPNKKTKRKKK
jgi:hypothetical protein